MRSFPSRQRRHCLAPWRTFSNNDCNEGCWQPEEEVTESKPGEGGEGPNDIPVDDVAEERDQEENQMENLEGQPERVQEGNMEEAIEGEEVEVQIAPPL